TLTGDGSANVMIGGRGSDTLLGNGGADVLRGGEGDDTLAVADLNFSRVVGGTGSDTLRLDTAGATLSLTTLADNRLLGIEQIDLGGSGANTLVLNVQEVLNISDESNTLIVLRDTDDTVVWDNGWQQQADETIGPNIFRVFTQGQATVKVQVGDPLSVGFVIDLAALTAAQGSVVFGADANDRSGRSVSIAGDVNGDGFDDLLIGADHAYASGNGKSYAGESYVIFGGASLPATIDLASLGAAGITIFGADADDHSGVSVSSAGDVNGDGFDDLLIGADRADASVTDTKEGETYVIFGGASLPATIDLSSPGAAGITVFGAGADDRSGRSVSGAGDVNGDGFDDLLIGTDYADASGNGKSHAGESYVIFGGASLPATINLAGLHPAGITIFGADASDRSGRSVNSAGDVNGDGFDDLLIGAYGAAASDNGKSDAGDSYVIFGGASLPATIDLASLGAAGITVFGADAGDGNGRSVSSAGDVNGDGFDDLLIGAYRADASGNGKSKAGESYVIFGGDFTGGVTHPGTVAADTLTGDGSANVMIGGRGSDTLLGNGGADVLRGGEGDDTLAVADLNFSR
ncbi:MAG: hypothetical protein GY716_16170, partial [bacterium]|nr:hypothetical protein [bacterium]